MPFFSIFHLTLLILYHNNMDYKNPSFDHPNLIKTLQKGTYKILDFEWRFAVTTKHSLINNHTQCLIQLKLELQGEQGKDRKSVHLELTMAEFNQLFREMEKVSNMLSIIN